jgi:branched-chain amino acid transport system permease protein
MTGQISLGHACFMGLGAYISTLFVIKASMSPWISLPIAMVITGIVAMVLLFPCFILRGPYFSMVTIAFAEVFRNFFTNWDFAQKANGISLPFGPDSLADFRFLSKIPYYYIGLIMVVLIYVLIKFIDKSKLGYALKTIREDEDTAAAIGINPAKFKIMAVGISAALMALTGFYYAQYFRYIDPEIMMLVYSTEMLLPAIIGGMGFAGGPILGSIVIVPLSEFLRSVLGEIPGVNLIVYALILIIIIRFQPIGMLGWWYSRQAKNRRNKEAKITNG